MGVGLADGGRLVHLQSARTDSHKPQYTDSCGTRNRGGLHITRVDCAAAAVRSVGGTRNKVVGVPRVSDISYAPAIYTLHWPSA